MIPTNANAVLLTHPKHANMASAISLVLASDDPNCRIICPEDVAIHLRKANMLKANKLVVLATGLSAEIESTISVTQVHGFRQVRLHTPRERGRDKLIPTKK